MQEDQEGNNYDYGYYFTGFVDILGQRHALRSININRDNHNDERELKKLKEVFGNIKYLRETMSDTLDSMSEKYFTIDPSIKNVPSSYKEFKKSMWRKAEFSSFSDTCVVFAKMSDKEFIPSLQPLLVITETIVLTTMFCLSKKILLRGAIELGIGGQFVMEKADRQIYGPVLATSADLEKKAYYPGILIGEELMRLIKHCHYAEKKSFLDIFNYEIAETFLKIVNLKKDGQYRLDMFNGYHKQIIDRNETMKVILNNKLFPDMHKSLSGYCSEIEHDTKIPAEEKGKIIEQIGIMQEEINAGFAKWGYNRTIEK